MLLNASINQTLILISQMADGDDSYVPLVTLTEEVAVVTGEQDEDVLYKERAKLYRFSQELSQWNERGTGDARLLKVTATLILHYYSVIL